MLTITPPAAVPEIIKEKFITEPAPNNHGYTSAFYAIDRKNGYKYLFEILEGRRPFYVVTTSDGQTDYIISLRQSSPATIDILHAEIYKSGSNYKTRREESPRLLKKYSFIAWLLYGLIVNGDAPAGIPDENPEPVTTGKPYPVIYYRLNAAARVMILTKQNFAWIDAPAADIAAYKDEIRKTDPAASFTDEAGPRYVFRTYSAWTADAAILREYTITAATEADAETIARALAAGQPYSINAAWTPDADPVKDRPKRRAAYRVECRSPRGEWTPYAAETETREESERIKEEAEARHTLTPDGTPIFYRIVQIDKGPEAAPDNIITESTETAPETVETETPGATTTTPKNEPQRAAARDDFNDINPEAVKKALADDPTGENNADLQKLITAAALADVPQAWEEIPAPAYIVQCRSPRRPWTDYSSPATLAECETIKARAEARRTCSVNGDLLIYRIIPTEATQTQMETTGAPEEIQTPMEAAEPGQPASPEETAGDSQTAMEDGRPAPAADGQTVMEDGGKAGQPADGQTGMDGGKDGGRQTGMESPEKARNSPIRAAPRTDYHHTTKAPKTG